MGNLVLLQDDSVEIRTSTKPCTQDDLVQFCPCQKASCPAACLKVIFLSELERVTACIYG